MRKLYSSFLASALFASALSGATLPGSAAAFSAEDKARVLYVGDSISFETRDMVQFFVTWGGKAEFAYIGFGGAAICDVIGNHNEFLDATNKLAYQVSHFRPHIIVLSFWGNVKWLSQCAPDGQNGAGRGTIAFYDQYRADAHAAAAEIMSAAAATPGAPTPKIRWVLQGPDKNNKEVSRTLNGIYTQLASETPSSSALIDAGYEVSMAAYPYAQIPDGRYTWTQHLPCTTIERGTAYCTNPEAFGGVTRLHKDFINPYTGGQAVDDVHFCLDAQLDPATGANVPDPDPWHCNTPSPGVLRFGMRVAGEINQALGI